MSREDVVSTFVGQNAVGATHLDQYAFDPAFQKVVCSPVAISGSVAVAPSVGGSAAVGASDAARGGVLDPGIRGGILSSSSSENRLSSESLEIQEHKPSQYYNL
jgi:hypothetical protein